ncbi:MAG: hypothetical protein HDR88_14785 [Bacteroides sp.]|nr:hypothetical protein [Bacteroides sp.]
MLYLHVTVCAFCTDCDGVSIILREASAVARSTVMGMPEPQDVERATDTDSSRFFFY